MHFVIRAYRPIFDRNIRNINFCRENLNRKFSINEKGQIKRTFPWKGIIIFHNHQICGQGMEQEKSTDGRINHVWGRPVNSFWPFLKFNFWGRCFFVLYEFWTINIFSWKQRWKILRGTFPIREIFRWNVEKWYFLHS